jgi:hypothetical protein
MLSYILNEVEEFSIRKPSASCILTNILISDLISKFEFSINNSQLTLNNLPHLCEKIKIGVGKNKI